MLARGQEDPESDVDMLVEVVEVLRSRLRATVVIGAIVAAAPLTVAAPARAQTSGWTECKSDFVCTWVLPGGIGPHNDYEITAKVKSGDCHDDNFESVANNFRDYSGWDPVVWTGPGCTGEHGRVVKGAKMNVSGASISLVFCRTFSSDETPKPGCGATR